MSASGDKSVLPTAIVTVDVPVRFAETDLMGIVHHSAYVIWFELARVSWMDAAGMPYVEVARGGNHFAVTGVHVEYRAPARFGDTVRVACWVTRLRSRHVTFEYEVTDSVSGTALATGRTEHICVDDAGRTARIPAPVLERLTRGLERLAAGGIQVVRGLTPGDPLDGIELSLAGGA